MGEEEKKTVCLTVDCRPAHAAGCMGARTAERPAQGAGSGVTTKHVLCLVVIITHQMPVRPNPLSTHSAMTVTNSPGTDRHEPWPWLLLTFHYEVVSTNRPVS
jgi:hypothetical protein